MQLKSLLLSALLIATPFNSFAHGGMQPQKQSNAKTVFNKFIFASLGCFGASIMLHTFNMVLNKESLIESGKLKKDFNPIRFTLFNSLIASYLFYAAHEGFTSQDKISK